MTSEEEALNKPYRSSAQMACGSGSYTGGQMGFACLLVTLRLWQDSGASTPHYGSVLHTKKFLREKENVSSFIISCAEGLCSWVLALHLVTCNRTTGAPEGGSMSPNSPNTMPLGNLFPPITIVGE